MTHIPRGIRNNNPGNIRKGSRWQGLALEQLDADFCSFITPEYGIRAIAKILLTYERRYGLRTVRGIITRWAPPVENNTKAYAEAVARALGIGADERMPSIRPFLKRLVVAIIHHENGIMPYSDEIIERGVEMAKC